MVLTNYEKGMLAIEHLENYQYDMKDHQFICSEACIDFIKFMWDNCQLIDDRMPTVMVLFSIWYNSHGLWWKIKFNIAAFLSDNFGLKSFKLR